MIRRQEGEEKFREMLKNPPKPPNSEPSPAMENYINDLNNGTLIENARKQEQKKKEIEAEAGVVLYCPTCRRPSLRPTGYKTYKCVHCGLDTNTPLRMAKR